MAMRERAEAAWEAVKERAEAAWEWGKERGESAWDRVRDRAGPPLERAWAATERVTAVVQPVVVRFLLVIVYVVGVGLTRLFAAVFARRQIAVDEAVETNGSFWRDAEGYEPDPVRLRKQL